MTERNLQPWERRDDESSPAWEAFRMYRDLGPAIRSTGQVQERIGKSRRLIDKWCSKYSWVERTREYDRSADAEQVDEYRQQVRRIVHQQTDLADKLLRHLDTTLDSMIVKGQDPTIRWTTAFTAATKVQGGAMDMVREKKDGTTDTVAAIERIIANLTKDDE